MLPAGTLGLGSLSLILWPSACLNIMCAAGLTMRFLMVPVNRNPRIGEPLPDTGVSMAGMSKELFPQILEPQDSSPPDSLKYLPLSPHKGCRERQKRLPGTRAVQFQGRGRGRGWGRGSPVAPLPPNPLSTAESCNLFPQHPTFSIGTRLSHSQC